MRNASGNTGFTYTRAANRFLTVAEEENAALAGNWVMEWGTISGNWNDGTTAEFWWHGVFRIEDGKIVWMRAFYDTGDILTQRGWTMVAPGSDADGEGTEEGDDGSPE